MSTFDLEQYISQYSGNLKIKRLLRIYECAPQYKNEAIRMIMLELRQCKNTKLYREVCKKFFENSEQIIFDESWANQVDEEAAKTLERLECELSSSKTTLIKESTRLCYNELGNFHYQRGDLGNALKNFVRTREYCTTSKQILVMCLNVIQVGLEMNNFSLVTQYVGKADQNDQTAKDKKELAKVRVAAALLQLESLKYRNAARNFLDIPVELGQNYSELISASDVAIFGVLCALASFDRKELKTKLMENVDFKNFLELVPEIREIIKDFHESRYTTCLSSLERHKEQFMLDIHLWPHVNTLYEQIRQRALKQYVFPFMSVDLNKMALSFNTTSQQLEKEVAQLIMDARIDSHNKILYARKDNERIVPFEKALQTGIEFIQETEANIRRFTMLRHDFQVRAQKINTF